MEPEGLVEIGDGLCSRCLSCTQGHEDSMLYDLAHLDDKTISNLLNESRYSVRGLQERAWRNAQARGAKTREERDPRKGTFPHGNERFSEMCVKDFVGSDETEGSSMSCPGSDQGSPTGRSYRTLMQEEEVRPEDIKSGLSEFIDDDLIEFDGDSIRITPKGSRKLARYVLRRLWENLSPTNGGLSVTREEGFGISDAFTSRSYEHGDEFHRIDIEATLLSALIRKPRETDRIEFHEEDLRVRETIEDTRLSVGLVVDESGSMSGDKIRAAMDISLALSEIIRRNPGDKMRVFLFSNQVREIRYWEMLNASFSGGTTDIRAAMRRFRLAVAGERADKQLYLITDTEPNSENGKYLGFEKAAVGVIEEAILYQKEKITLNIVMLDTTPRLTDFASFLAMRNLGRVFFTQPRDLGRVVMEDYLRAKRKNRSRKLR